jgi:hypothetical protein
MAGYMLHAIHDLERNLVDSASPINMRLRDEIPK